MNQEIEVLIFRAYHGELSEVGSDILTQWINASPEHARQVVEYSVDSHSIKTALRNSQVAQDANTNKPAMMECENQTGTPGSSTHPVFRRVAALLVITTIVGLALWLGWNQQAQENREHAQVATTSPVQLASVQVMESTDLKWNRYTNDEDSETVVIPASGFLYHEFRGDGFILLEGPTTYQLVDNYTIRLLEGRLVAKANPAEVFTILVDDTRITVVDAEFGVQNIDNDVPSAILFEGFADVTQDQSPTRVTAGQIVSMRPDVDIADQLARATRKDSSEYTRLLDSVKLRPSHMANSVQFLPDAPDSLLAGDLTDRDNVWMFCEQAGVSVKADELPTIPNRQTDLGEVPADLLLDSYLIHFDPQVDGSQSESRTTGMVIFDRPIHAVLGSSLSIQSTDAFFSSANTAYPRNSR